MGERTGGRANVYLLAGAVALVALIAVGAVFGVRRVRARRDEQQRIASERARKSAPAVRCVRATRVARMRERIELSGTIRSRRDVHVLPEVAGKLERFDAVRARRVAAGQILAVIESDMLMAQYEQARAALAVAESGLTAARVAKENAASERERTRRLEATASASEREIDAAETGLRAAEAQLAVAASQVERARAAVELARLGLEKARIAAPFAGVVADGFGHSVGATVGPQTPIARIVDMDALTIDLSAAERELGRLAPGQAAEVLVSSMPGRTFAGAVAVVGPAVDPATRTAPVEVGIENVTEGGSHILRPGMFAEVRVTVGERRDVVGVPVAALTAVGGETVVFVPELPADEGGTVRLEARAVATGVRDGDTVEIIEGLSEGELFVVAGVRALVPGARVRMEEAGEGNGVPSVGREDQAR